MRKRIILGKFVIEVGINSGWSVFGLWFLVDPTKPKLGELIILDLHIFGAFVQINYVFEDSLLKFIKDEL